MASEQFQIEDHVTNALSLNSIVSILIHHLYYHILT
nr:MAG TPA: hypothetical protein [Caudoviricetes sp.]